MAKDETGRLSGYGSHKDKRLKREQNLLQRLLDEELEDFDSEDSNNSGLGFGNRTK